MTVELFARGDGCEVVLTHERLLSADAMRQQWSQILERLAEHVQKTGSRGSRPAGMTRGFGPRGRR